MNHQFEDGTHMTANFAIIRYWGI